MTDDENRDFKRILARSMTMNFKICHIQETEISRLALPTFEVDGILKTLQWCP